MLRRKIPAPGPLTLTLSTMALLWLVAGPATPGTAQGLDPGNPADAVGVTTGHAAATGEVHGADASHGAGHGGEANILEPQPTLAIYTLIVFLILLAVLWRFAWGPLSRALHDREHSLETAFQDAERARAEAAALLEQHRRQMDQVQDQVRQIMDEANRKAQVAYDERLGQARADAEATAQRATREIAGAKEQALAELYERSADLAVAVAGRVLQRELGHDDQRRLIEVASQELQAVGGPNGRGGLA